jgi:hypothetical protein
MEFLVAKYGVNHSVASPYHHQTSGQVELSNMENKFVLENTVNRARSNWPLKINDAYEPIELLLKILCVCLSL